MKLDILFPNLPVKPWKYVDLNAEFEKRRHLNMKHIPDQIQLLYEVSDQGQTYTYGGYGEDRTEIWKDFEPGGVKMWHLGVDYNNLPVGQEVGSVSDGVVVHILYDHSGFNGWGTRIMIRNETPIRDNIYYLYGHLSTTTLEVGQSVTRGQIIGLIGDEAVNGGWFPHLHLQIMTDQFVKKFDHYEEIDGYDFARNVDEIEGLIDPNTLFH